MPRPVVDEPNSNRHGFWIYTSKLWIVERCPIGEVEGVVSGLASRQICWHGTPESFLDLGDAHGCEHFCFWDRF